MCVCVCVICLFFSFFDWFCLVMFGRFRVHGEYCSTVFCVSVSVASWQLKIGPRNWPRLIKLPTVTSKERTLLEVEVEAVSPLTAPNQYFCLKLRRLLI